jgi:hypothetical protein
MKIREPTRTWIAFFLVGISACLLWLVAAEVVMVARGWFSIVGGVLAATALFVLVQPLGSVKRPPAQVFEDLRRGRQVATTSLQKLCFGLALLLLAAQVAQSLH